MTVTEVNHEKELHDENENGCEVVVEDYLEVDDGEAPNVYQDVQQLPDKVGTVTWVSQSLQHSHSGVVVLANSEASVMIYTICIIFHFLGEYFGELVVYVHHHSNGNIVFSDE